MTTQQPRIWFITGSSRGLGRALTETVLELGDSVVATARKPERLTDLVQQYGDRLLALPLDVTQPFAIQTAVMHALQAFGHVDVLVNNAGYGVFGAVEEVTAPAVRQQFETNVYGALEVTCALLPHLRRQRSGHILNISSSGGFVGFPGAGIYGASKFALEGWSEALAQEVAPLGIRVTIVEPGAFRTAFNGVLRSPAQTIQDYAETSGQMMHWLRQMHGQQPGDPQKAAAAMMQVVDHPDPPLRLVLGADALIQRVAVLLIATISLSILMSQPLHPDAALNLMPSLI
ncbi:short-chain dehydrogenase family oxidoreductase [Halomicronema hongdechloris C2206]|uniref:Short-chain dehydrogenase family oxidoreductase n=1 Tax=Halomicronema hongdechloris C2206 TaxID=1641165 RepID=A0A1Z3HSF6_9CYAN|nr:oxidoreductase [Halomicronema hongdechloris]ASC73239.1 short-chain dehydrogenase family oxidoreductase [Halomicronema hongdechloris C2206]